MQDPVHEISNVVKRLCVGSDPTAQQDTVLRYFHPTAALDHPYAKVEAHPGSREIIGRIYQFYKQQSPEIELEVSSVGQNLGHQMGRLYVDCRQRWTYHPRIFPGRHVSIPLTVVLTLHKESDGLWYITKQEDMYQPEDFLAFTFIGVRPIVSFLKHLNAYNSVFLAWVLEGFGVWRPSRQKVVGQD